MKNLKALTFSILTITLLTSCGGGGGGAQNADGNLSGAASSQSQKDQIINSSVLEKQFSKKAQELLDFQEHYEGHYEDYSQKKLFEMVAEFEQGKRELESLQDQIAQQKEASNISFKTLDEVQKSYKNRHQDILLVDQDIALTTLHKDALNLRDNVLELIKERKVRAFKELDFRREQKFQVYETKMFVYLQRF